MRKKTQFTKEEISSIVFDYNENRLSCSKIGKNFGISKLPIRTLLKEMGILRAGYSNGIKIELTEELKNTIKKLYLDDHKNCNEIGKILKLNKCFIDAHIQKNGYRRTKGESISLRQLGKKRTEKVKSILKNAQQTFARSGYRKQTGGICKRYIVNGLICDGTYEKFYIEKLIRDKKKLPQNSESINTPFGVYYPDFLNDKLIIEIKSDYTYDVLIGKKISRWAKKIDTIQLEKIKWVNKNIKPVDILIIDKNNNKIIKKEIL